MEGGRVERIMGRIPGSAAMSLAAGARLGPYEVVGPIGAGGMGEVYRARDTRLGRDVAVKVLPAERLADPHRRARFVQEARAASALNHPNIVTIHEIESAEGIDFIVMELVPGETLAQRLRRGALGTDEALRLAIPVADALAAAHATGIVHRDLKPGNVMVTPDGVVKVLDFGLAKVLRSDSSDSDETTATEAGPLSQPGAVAGTAGYLSPEQARGAEVDARSDVFSFGVLLYEMVTGRRAFPGDSSGEAIAAVLKEQPKPPSEVALGIPRDLERIILRCLRKDPGRRFQHMDDVKIELREVKEESDSQASAPAAVAARRSLRRRHVAWITITVVALIGVAAGKLWRPRRGEPSAPRVVSLTSARQAHSGSFSPDGTQIAFASAGEKGDNWDIWLKIPGEPEGRRLTTDPAVDDFPAWSPDGKLIAFLRHRDVPRLLGGLFDSTGFIHLVSPLGGSERRLSDVPVRNQLSWSPDGHWLAMARVRGDDEAAPEAGGVHLSPAGGGPTRPLTFPRSPGFDVSPAFSPDGRSLAYASCWGMGAVSCDVHLLPLDADLRPAGPPRRLTQQSLWTLGVAWTRDGRSIVYGTAEGSRLWRVRADGSAAPERVDLAGRGATYPAAVGAGDRLAFVRQFWDVDIYRVNLGGATTPLVESTLEIADLGAEYSPDGRRIAFFSNRGNEWYEIWLAEADGSNPVRLTHGPGSNQNSPVWSPDGRTIAFQSKPENAGFDIWTIGVDGAGLRQVTRDPDDDQGPKWSPDGRWIYFLSSRSGRGEIWRAAASGGSEEQVTRGGAYWHALSRDGRSLYYVKTARGSGLFARPTEGDEERPIIRCQSGYAVGPAGVFYVGCGSAEAPTGSRYPLRYWDAATGHDRQVGTIDAVYVAGLSVSPDGRSLLYGRSSWACDLMMVENFR